MNYPYAVILDKDKEEDIPVISKEQIERFKQEMPVYYEEDWVDCKDCLWHELGDCDGPESDEYGCYRGEKMDGGNK